jgi:FlaA1/EpsC-like NDP-sugar epimerase
MGRPVHILDLAYDLIRLSGLVPEQDIAVTIIGTRRGEKMQEELLTSAEPHHAHKECPFFVVPPQDVPLASLLSYVEELLLAGEENDLPRVHKIMEDVIPDFRSYTTQSFCTARERFRVIHPRMELEGALFESSL